MSDSTERPGRTLEITMKYTKERARTISGVRRVSKPGLRVYTAADKLPRVLGGLGVATEVLSQLMELGPRSTSRRTDRSSAT